MKYFIKTSFLFLILFISSYIILIILFGDYAPVLFKKNLNYKIGSYGHMFSRISELKDRKNVDILFVGSSHSYRGFDTRIFKEYDFETFNIGSSSQSPIQEELLLNQYLDKLNPKLVVFEMFPQIFESDGVESGLDILANNSIDLNSLIMCLKINNIKLYNTMLYGLYRQLRGVKNVFKEEIVKNEDLYVAGGYVEREISYYPTPKNKIKHDEYKLNKQQVKTFKNILQTLSSKKIKYILVQAPITKSLYNSYPNNNQIDSIFNSWGTYYNFNKILNLKDSLFYDSHHLNQNGVKEFNHAFIDLLQKDHSIKH